MTHIYPQRQTHPQNLTPTHRMKQQLSKLSKKRHVKVGTLGVI